VCCCKATNSSILIGSSQQLRHYGPPASSCCSVGEPVHPIFIGSIGRSYLHPQIRKSGWVERSSPYLSLNSYYRSPENEKRNHHIQFNKNNILRNKIVEQTYHKVLSMCVSTNNSIGLGSRPRDVAC
jgi:hypothetical protein